MQVLFFLCVLQLNINKKKITFLPLRPFNHPLAVRSVALCNYLHFLVSNSTTVLPATVFGNNSKSHLSIFRIHFGSFSIVNVLQLLHIRLFFFFCAKLRCATNYILISLGCLPHSSFAVDLHANIEARNSIWCCQLVDSQEYHNYNLRIENKYCEM